jgi:NDP-sugar pyrophosphorylase family protein
MSKSRLTITLSDEILHTVDTTIDGKNIRNRSHAIESLLVKQLAGSVSQAIVLAGGHDHAINNALINISGKPLVQHTVELLSAYGISQIFVLTDMSTRSLKAALTQNNVTIIRQRENLGTAGAIYQLRDSLNHQPFLVIHGDIYTDVNIETFASFHSKQNKLGTICVKPKLNQQQYGKVIMEGNQITQFFSNPKQSEVGMINTGIYLFDRNILDRIKKRGRNMLETDIFPQLAHEGELSGYIFEGMWYEVKQ